MNFIDFKTGIGRKAMSRRSIALQWERSTWRRWVSKLDATESHLLAGIREGTPR